MKLKSKNHYFNSLINKGKSINFHLLLLVMVLGLISFANGGESITGQLIFFAFPLFFFPILKSKQRKIHKGHGVIFGLWIAYFLAETISTVFSVSRAYSLGTLLKIATVFIYFSFFYFTVESGGDLKKFAKAIIFTGFFLSLLSFYHIFFPPQGLTVMNFTYAVYGHNHLADYLIFVLPLIMTALLRKPVIKSKDKLLVLFFFISFYLTFARTALVIMAFITIIIVYYYKPEKKRAFYLLFLGLLPLLMVSAATFFPFSALEKNLQLDRQVQLRWLYRQLVKPYDADGRFFYWKQAIKGFSQKPWLGNGPGTFRLISSKYAENGFSSWFTHNYFLQNLTDSGIIGSVILILLLFFLAAKIKVSSEKKVDYTLPLILGAGGSLLQSFFSYNFDFLAVFLLFFSVLAALLQVSGRNKARKIKELNAFLLMFSVLAFAFSASLGTGEYLRQKASKKALNEKTQAFWEYKKSMYLPGIGNQRFVNFLWMAAALTDLSADNIPEKYIIAFNKEDSQIYGALAQLYLPTPHSLELIREALPFTPPLKKIQYLDYAIRVGSDEQLIVDIFFEVTLALSSNNQKSQILDLKSGNEKLLREKIKDYYSTAISSEVKSRRFISKVFYAVGLEKYKEGKDFKETAEFWRQARIFSPDYDYFFKESAALEYYVFNNGEEAFKILKECLVNEFSQESCQNQLNLPGENLHLPGYFAAEIEKIK